MTGTIPTQIWLALKSRIDTLDLATPIWPQWPVAWQGSAFVPVSGKPFLAVGRSTAAPRRTRINRAVNDREGIMTLSAVMPLGQATMIYEEQAGKIADHFTPCIYRDGLTLTMMSQSGNVPYVGDGYRDGDWWRVPVNIPWRTWA